MPTDQAPCMLVAAPNGEVRSTALTALGRRGREYCPIEHWVPMPPGSQLLTMPDCRPVGMRAGECVAMGEGLPVAVALPHGYTRTYLPAYAKDVAAPLLPLFGYTAVAERDGEFVVAALQTDDAPEWHPAQFGGPDLPRRIAALQREMPANDLVRQISKCAGEYGCYTAQNTFYDRWEAALPTSNACNASCIGCISEQEADGPPTPQERIRAMARRRDVVEVAVRHLERADPAMVSYGQGCEGEPLLNWRMLVAATEAIRRRTGRGWINVNTNGCNPRAMAALITAGLDACRVSVFSARQDVFAAYYRPRNYTIADVEETLSVASAAGLFTSVNLLTFPGITDQEREVEAMIAMLRRTGVRMVQMRNLTIDPEQLLDALPPPDSAALGVETLVQRLRSELPGLIIGNSSRLPGQTPGAPRTSQCAIL
jgi:pyruvate-formate lyase-activating enzyme